MESHAQEFHEEMGDLQVNALFGQVNGFRWLKLPGIGWWFGGEAVCAGKNFSLKNSV